MVQRAWLNEAPRVSRLFIATYRDRRADPYRQQDLAIAPDGSRVVYVGNSGTQLFVRALDTLEPVVVFTSANGAGRLSPPMANGSDSWTAAR